MGRPCKFTEEQKIAIKKMILANSVIEDGLRRSMTSDEEMSSVLANMGYEANTKYVFRVRSELKILPLVHTRKFSHEEFKGVMVIFHSYVIPDRNHGSKLSVSDARLASIISDRGLQVDAKYIERMRQDLGINAYQQRSLMNARIKRNNEDDDHIQAVMELSVKRRPSANTYGASGTDAYTAGIGAHTLSYDDALEKKDKQIQRLRTKEITRLANKEAEMDRVIELRLQHPEIVAKAREAIFNEDLRPAIMNTLNGNGCYKKGKGGAKRSAHNAQAYQSIQ